MCACTILKCMHIIHHLDGRELLFVLPMSDQEVFHVVEEKVYRVIGGMLAAGFPIIEFVGGRKNKDSLFTKLLSKQETIAAQIFDKLRFRIVTRSRDDIFPILQYLTKRLFPFNYVVPGQSINSIFGFRSYVEKTPLEPLLPQLQAHCGRRDDDYTPERQPVLRRVVPDHPLRRGHAGAPAPADPRRRARRARPRSATSSSSSASSRSSTATPRPTTSSARPRTPSTRSGRRRP